MRSLGKIGKNFKNYTNWYDSVLISANDTIIRGVYPAIEYLERVRY